MHQSLKAKLSRPEPAYLSINTPRDPNTVSNYNNFVTTHTAVDFEVDFDKRRLRGDVVLTFRSITEAESDEIVLDTSFPNGADGMASYLDIKDITISGSAVEWHVGSRFEPFGSPLSIKLKRGVKKDEELKVKITVSTTDNCTALQWLTPAQTSNRKHPYMYTPDVKSPFSLTIRSKLSVVASGRRDEGKSDPKARIWVFEQPVPIPSYLFAIASGDLASAKIGPRSEVWTGPDEVEACKWELEDDTEKFLQTAEKLVFPYEWDTYNCLVLPPSFPYGGMENPQYTFLTPTTISGDRQNVDVVAHELSHSWSGNLVSPSSWQHFWLNEGWTTYLERRIQAAVHGEPARDFSAIIGWKALQDSIEAFGQDHEFTKLIVDLKGKDPDDAFSTVPYEKGFVFLYHLEKLLGQAKWDKFIPHYFTTFKYQSLDSYDFKSTLLSFFSKDEQATALLNEVQWDDWFYKPGFPPKPHFDTSMADACYELADKWESLAAGASKFNPAPEDVKDLNANQIVVFLERLQRFQTPLAAKYAQKLGSTYSIEHSKNVELVSRWLVLGLQWAGNGKSNEESKRILDNIVKRTSTLLSNVGRMKFVRPLYRQLRDSVSIEEARTIFKQNRDFYHPICRGLVEKDLGLA
ncbi:MAG: hypothetical protein M1831_007123 [Alyxoria varia]|nr:MAG: hypothetical protein M1831_007123 [Alyxoria varia]